jgi:hypothetical protein
VQGLHKGVRACCGPTLDVVEVLTSGKILDEPISGKVGREEQLRRLQQMVSLILSKAAEGELEREVELAREVEGAWVYEDFERTILRAIPDLLPQAED